MKIGIIVRRLDRLAGVERHAFNVAIELQKRGHHVTLYAFHANTERTFAEGRNLPIVALNPKEGFFSRFFRAIPLLSGMAQYFRECSLSYQLALKINPETEILNPHDQLVYRVAAYYKRKVCNIPSVWAMHDMPTRTFSRMREFECGSTPRRSFFKIIDAILDSFEYQRFIKIQDVITVLDERDRQWVKEYFNKDAIITRSGVNINDFLSTRKDIIKPPQQLLMLGIFFPHRRFEDGVYALSLLKDQGINCTLTIIGGYRTSDAYFEKINDLIQKNGLSHLVILKGRVSEEELKKAYQEADIFLFPNHLQSWGIAVFEALASGLPVIVSSTAGASEVLTHRTNALIVPPKNPSALAEAIVTLVKDAELYKKLSINGRHLVENDLSWVRIADVIESILQKTLAQSNISP